MVLKRTNFVIVNTIVCKARDNSKLLSKTWRCLDANSMRAFLLYLTALIPLAMAFACSDKTLSPIKIQPRLAHKQNSIILQTLPEKQIV